ncbi:MAG: hypothetical protein IMZ57_04110 [Acidobacteria bacterium]|nr:hypothetical protein [Acidobacteriota bacterium]
MGLTVTMTSAATAGTGIAPTTELAKLKILFGATGTGSTDRTSVITSEMGHAFTLLWYYAPWMFRHVRLDLVTVANQAYTTLPADFHQDVTAGDWLVDGTTHSYRPVYVPPSQWDTDLGNTWDINGTTGAPRIYTFGNESGSPVVRWGPTPTGIQTFKGFQYFKAPADAFSATSAASLFPDPISPEFDDVWDLLCKYRIASGGLYTVEAGPRFVGWPIIQMRLDALRARYVYRYLPTQPRDCLGLTDDLAVTFGSTVSNYPYLDV